MIEIIAQFLAFLILFLGGIGVLIYTLSISLFCKAMSGSNKWSTREICFIIGCFVASGLIIWVGFVVAPFSLTFGA